MTEKPVTGGTGLPEERSELPIIQKEKQAGLTSEAPQLPEGTAVEGTKIESSENEFLPSPAPLVEKTQTTATSPTENLSVNVPVSQNANTYTAYVDPSTPQASAAQGTLNSQAVVGNIEGAVSQDAKASAITQQLNKKATVKYQLEE